MMGIAYLLVLSAYGYGVLRASKLLSSRHARIAFVLVMAYAPFWDVLPSRVYYAHLCSTRAGTFVHSPPIFVDGYATDIVGREVASQILTARGFRYIESIRPDGTIDRLWRDADGTIRHEIATVSQSEIVRRSANERDPWRSRIQRMVVRDLRTNKILGESTGVILQAPWLFSFGDDTVPKNVDACWGDVSQARQFRDLIQPKVPGHAQ